MPEFPESDAEIEALVRSLVADKSRDVEGVGHVFTERFYIVGKQQYVEKLGKESQTDGDVEVRCLFVEFVGYEDTGKGCDDAPIYYLVYSLRAFQEFVEREDGSSSSKEFPKFVMNLRAKFLKGRDLGFPERLRHENLKPTAPIRIDDDDLTGAFGHLALFTLKVEVVPSDES